MTGRLPIAEEQPSVDRSVMVSRIVGSGAGAASLGLFAGAWAADSLALHLAAVAWYLFTAGLIWVVSGIPRKRQRELDRQWAGRFHELAIRDDLTGLFNRRYFNHELERLIGESHVHRLPLTLALIDLNDFKVINDTYGHAAGDLALRLVAECITSVAGPTTVAARTGGDEFALIMPAMPASEAHAILGALRHKLETTPFALDGRRPAEPLIHAAVGLATMEDFTEAERLLRQADVALYENKCEVGRLYERRRAS